MLYFVRSGDYVKIGYTRSPDTLGARMEALSVGSPHPVEVLGVTDGDRDEEQRWHERFAHLAAEGEWFRVEPGLLATIASAASPPSDDAVRVRSARLSFRCTPELVEAVDEVRGGTPREKWLRQKVSHAVDLARGSGVDLARAAVSEGLGETGYGEKSPPMLGVPEGLKPLSDTSGPVQMKRARTGMCEHRVPAYAYCGRCDG